MNEVKPGVAMARRARRDKERADLLGGGCLLLSFLWVPLPLLLALALLRWLGGCSG